VIIACSGSGSLLNNLEHSSISQRGISHRHENSRNYLHFGHGSSIASRMLHILHGLFTHMSECRQTYSIHQALVGTSRYKLVADSLGSRRWSPHERQTRVQQEIVSYRAGCYHEGRSSFFVHDIEYPVGVDGARNSQEYVHFFHFSAYFTHMSGIRSCNGTTPRNESLEFRVHQSREEVAPIQSFGSRHRSNNCFISRSGATSRSRIREQHPRETPWLLPGRHSKQMVIVTMGQRWRRTLSKPRPQE
jgi:hypothetical protein